MFFKGSRYAKVGTTESLLNGRAVRYKRLRLLDRPRIVRRHALVEGRRRLDLVAWRHFRDAERYWRICDANLALWPDDLVAEPNESIGIPQAKG